MPRPEGGAPGQQQMHKIVKRDEQGNIVAEGSVSQAEWKGSRRTLMAEGWRRLDEDGTEVEEEEVETPETPEGESER